MRRAGFRGVLAVREFRALWAAELLSVAGDQLARVGLSVLVYAQTSSAGLTALTYALTFLPALAGGVLLGRLADRYPRRELMVCVDLLRAALAGLMAIPSLPLPVLLGLVFLVTLAGAPFKAAQQALLPAILSGESYVAGLALRTVTNQTAQVAGFLGGGVLVAVVEPHLALGLNAVTFLLAAAVLTAGVARRPAVRGPGGRSPGAARLIWQDRRLRGLTALSWLAGLFVVPEGLAAPYAAGLGAPVAAVGLLLAAGPAGSIVGGWLLTRAGPGRTDRATGAFAVAAGVPLVLCLTDPPLVVVILLWAASGALATGYLVPAQASFVLAVPDQRRGAASGLAGAGVLSSQGVAVLGGGILADLTSPVLAVAAGGVAGVVLTGLVWTSWLRARGRRGGRGGRETDDVKQVDQSSDPDRGVTSPSSATSLTPPPQGTAAGNGDGYVDQLPKITSPNYATSLTPPSTEMPAEHPASLSTDQRSRAPAGWAIWRESTRVLTLLLVVETATAGLTAFQLPRAQLDRHDLVTLGVVIGLGLAMGEMTRHVERVRRRFNDTPHVNLTSVWTFSAILLLPPVLVPVVICALYLHLFWRSWYRVRSVHAYRLVFTASTVVLAAYSASAVRHLLAPADMRDWTSPPAVGAVVLAVLVYSVVNLGLVATAITLHERRLHLRRALGTGKEAALEYGTIGLGAATALLIDIHPAWALLIVPALLVLHRSVLMRQLEEAASTDQKTGLANATAWTNLATAEVRRAAREETRVGVLMVDLDHFKAVNDTHGHLVGDRVLKAVADTLTGCTRRYDVVGRWGGEEFVVLCPEVTQETLHAMGERICERVRELRVPIGEPGGEPAGAVVDGLSVSIGLAMYPKFGPELQDVLLAADDALFVAKDSGRNQVQTIVAAVGDLNGQR